MPPDEVELKRRALTTVRPAFVLGRNASVERPFAAEFRVYNFSAEWTGRKFRSRPGFDRDQFVLLAAHALSLSPHAAKRATDADPASGPGIDGRPLPAPSTRTTLALAPSTVLAP